MGKSAQVGAQWTDKFGRVRTPSAEFYDDDGNLVAVGQEAIERFDAHLDEVRLHNHRVRALSRRRRQGRSSRPATNARSRGSKRGCSARRSSERSGDSGSDSDSSEPPGRTCGCGCGLDISHRAPQARYASDAHAAYARPRRKRARTRDWSPDVSRRDSYFRFDVPTYEQVRKRIEDGCRCNGSHIADAEDGHCVKCGHRRAWALPAATSIAAGSAETRRPRKAVV
jgi:hypothetical protein